MFLKNHSTNLIIQKNSERIILMFKNYSNCNCFFCNKPILKIFQNLDSINKSCCKKNPKLIQFTMLYRKEWIIKSKNCLFINL